jgi:hypothetical protein
MVGAHTKTKINKNINISTFRVGRIGSHTLRGMAFLRTESGVVKFVSKINLIFWGNPVG